jgi:ATP-dependent Lon protease
MATLCRKVAREVVSRKVKKLPESLIKVTSKSLEDYLGPPRYNATMAEAQNEIGLVNGLAWTEVGGDMLQIEVTTFPGKGKLTITGKLGEVMQESAQAAFSYVRSRGDRLGLEKDFVEKLDIHIHVPEGSIPKDGPSAGITMATSITSALTKIPVKRNVAMTGEITLRGRVLPIGGLKEKMLAAKIGGADTVIIPKQNVPDLKKIPKEITRGLKIIPVDHADEVLKIALDVTDPELLLRPAGVPTETPAAKVTKPDEGGTTGTRAH